MRAANFCRECGEQLARKGWRARFGASLCDRCAQRLGTVASFRWLVALVLVTAAAFAFGRYLRPPPPPLIIQRAADSPLPDAPVDPNQTRRAFKEADTSTRAVNLAVSTADDVVYICGARTKKGTP